MRDLVLDFWRGIGILMVLAHHLVLFYYGWRGSEFLVDMFERAGPLGVKFFFIVSGYIITRLMLAEEEKRGRLRVGDFYVRRIFRILPPYLLYLLGIFAFSASGWIAVSNADVLTAGAFLCNTALPCGWFVVHTWTLAIEMQFYLLWPVIFIALPARYRAPFLTALLALLFTLSAFGVLVERGWIDNALSFACIALGALGAVHPYARAALKDCGFLFIGAVALAVGIVYSAGFADAAKIMYRTATPLLLAALIFSTYRFPRLISSRPFAAVSGIGLVSYSLYLWQQAFVAPAGYYLSPSLLQYVFLMAVFCLFSYYFVEKPFIRLGKKLLQKKELRAKV